MIYAKEKDYTLYQGKMQDVLDTLEENSIDSIVCDPPYELNFMGKGWDNQGIAFQPNTWKHCYRVLKDGGYLLAFGGSRTFHRIACAIEDAGFEIRDTIMWLYGMGFPKSQNIGKQLEKRLEDEKTKQKTEYDLRLMWKRNIQKTKHNENKQDEIVQSELSKQSLQSSINTANNVWGEQSSLERWNNIQKTERELQRCQICEMSKRVFINGEERWVCNGTQISDGTTLRKMFEQSGSCSSYRPQPQQQRDRKLNAIQEQCGAQESREVIEYWNKFGTALKPAYEPIIVARKPFKGSLVDNVIENGVGGINIDECRVAYLNDNDKKSSLVGFKEGQIQDTNVNFLASPLKKAKTIEELPDGRFPANVILTYDDTDFEEVCGGMPDTKSGNITKEYKQNARFDIAQSGKGGNLDFSNCYGDNGSASRYFYCAKASKKDRDEGLEEFEEKRKAGYGYDLGFMNAGEGMFKERQTLKKNIHPTVKPIELMQYLVRLVTPKNATILDCFMGSGSTGKAVMFENRERNANYHFIGVEMTEEYLPICKARIDYALNKYEYDFQKQLKEEKDKGQLSIFDFMEN